jgi:ABC-2 type transport system ATP-binding protein
VSSHILSDIDRICTDVGVISEGKGIFSGSIKDMKKRTRSHVVRLELEGDAGKFCESLRATKWVAGFETRGGFGVDITFDPVMPMADAIREVTNLVSAHGLDLISISSSTSSIEDAFMELLRDEESRGFLRAG